jgi:catechol 2,3-dioxygenase-like lactoylglutathione lyase family enzyme
MSPGPGPTPALESRASVHLFHYHLVTGKVRQVEARYLGKLGFDLVAHHGRIADDLTSFEAGSSWEELDRIGFKLRLLELERGGVNVVVQPGQWDLPRIDHLGLALAEDDFEATLDRAEELELRVQDHGGRRTFVSTKGGFRLEVHPPRDWLDELLKGEIDFRVGELHLLADDPNQKALALAEVLGLEPAGSSVKVGDALVRFLPGGPQGRPQLKAELFL